MKQWISRDTILLTVFTCCIGYIGIRIGYFCGFQYSVAKIAEMQQSALKAGVAKVSTNELGETRFQWNTVKRPQKKGTLL